MKNSYTVKTKGSIAAVNASIAHWTKKIEELERGYGGRYMGVFDCALCRKYSFNACRGCPLNMAGNKCGTTGSDWMTWNNAFNEWRFLRRSKSTLHLNLKPQLSAARAMLRALKRLLPKAKSIAKKKERRK